MSIYDDSFKRMSQTLSETMEHISQVQKEIFTTTFSTSEIVTKALEPYKNFGQTLQETFSASFPNIMEPYMSELAQVISKSIYENLNVTLKNSPYFDELSSMLQNAIPNLAFVSFPHTYDFSKNPIFFPETVGDYVIVDNSAVKMCGIPASAIVPTGEHRTKLTTPMFLTIIDIVLSAFIAISMGIAQLHSSSVSANKQLAVEETQTKLLKSQNEILQQLLHDIDVSSSSEARSIKALKETVEEFSRTQNMHSLSEEDLEISDKDQDADASQ